jgi:hypothetical protein
LTCIDYYQFWVAGLAAREPTTGDIYSDSERLRLGEAFRARAEQTAAGKAQVPKQLQAAQSRRVLETYSTPWLYTAFGLVSSGTYEKDQNRYLDFCLIVLVLSIAGISRLLGYSPAAALVAVITFSLWFRPVLSDMHVGNVNRLQLGLLGLFLWVQCREPGPWRDAAAGFILGIAILFKPNAAFVAIVLVGGWIVLRQYRKAALELAGMLAAALVAVAAAFWYARSALPWASWARELSRLMNEYDLSATKGNYSLAWLLEERLGFSVAAALLVVGCALVYVALRPARAIEEPGRESLVRQDVALLALGCLLSLLMAKLAWLHYFVLAIPALLLLLRPAFPREAGAAWAGTPRGLALLGGAMLALDPFLLLFRIDEAHPGAVWVVAGGTLLLFVLVLWDTRLSPVRSAGPA